MKDCVKRAFAVLLWSVQSEHPNSQSTRIQHYLRAKGVADGYLRASGFGPTILAPGTLLDEKGTGRIQASEELGFHGYFYLS